MLGMNPFRIAGDISHVLAFVLLYYKIWKTGSCAGLSGKTQILYTTVFVTRYLDIFLYFLSVYHTAMKIAFILASSGMVYLIYFKFKSKDNSEQDTFRLECPYFLAVILAFTYNYGFNLREVCWTFSIYLEALAILPQLFMVYKKGKMEYFVPHYLTAMFLYRGFYILNWIYRYNTENRYDFITIYSGVVQTTVYIIFFFLYVMKDEDGFQKKPLPDLDDCSKTVWI